MDDEGIQTKEMFIELAMSANAVINLRKLDMPGINEEPINLLLVSLNKLRAPDRGLIDIINLIRFSLSLGELSNLGIDT